MVKPCTQGALIFCFHSKQKMDLAFSHRSSLEEESSRKPPRGFGYEQTDFINLKKPMISVCVLQNVVSSWTNLTYELLTFATGSWQNLIRPFANSLQFHMSYGESVWFRPSQRLIAQLAIEPATSGFLVRYFYRWPALTAHSSACGNVHRLIEWRQPTNLFSIFVQALSATCQKINEQHN